MCGSRVVRCAGQLKLSPADVHTILCAADQAAGIGLFRCVWLQIAEPESSRNAGRRLVSEIQPRDRTESAAAAGIWGLEPRMDTDQHG